MASTAMMAILQHPAESRDTIQAAIDDPAFCRAIDGIVGVIATALTDGRKLLLAGNGGSTADGQHIAGEMLSRFNHDRAPIAALALTTDSSVLTAIGNDYGYERLFERSSWGSAVPVMCLSRSLHRGGRRIFCGLSMRLGKNISSPSASPDEGAVKWLRAAICACMRHRILRRSFSRSISWPGI
jgi:SIS domain